MDWNLNRKSHKHRKECDWCGGAFRLRKYTDTDFKRVYCSDICLSEGRSECIQHMEAAKETTNGTHILNGRCTVQSMLRLVIGGRG